MSMCVYFVVLRLYALPGAFLCVYAILRVALVVGRGLSRLYRPIINAAPCLGGRGVPRFGEGVQIAGRLGGRGPGSIIRCPASRFCSESESSVQPQLFSRPSFAALTMTKVPHSHSHSHSAFSRSSLPTQRMATSLPDWKPVRSSVLLLVIG